MGTLLTSWLQISVSCKLDLLHQCFTVVVKDIAVWFANPQKAVD